MLETIQGIYKNGQIELPQNTPINYRELCFCDIFTN